MSSLTDYEPVVGARTIAELRKAAASLAGRRVKMVNSTAHGGGVAEILHRLVPLLNELGVATERLPADQPGQRRRADPR